MVSQFENRAGGTRRAATEQEWPARLECGLSPRLVPGKQTAEHDRSTDDTPEHRQEDDAVHLSGRQMAEREEGSGADDNQDDASADSEKEQDRLWSHQR